MTKQKIMWIILTVIIVLIIGYFVVYYFTMKNVNEPTYRLISRHGNIEKRYYSPLLIAEVKESGQRDIAINNGFRQLANYIFGNNRQISNQQSTKIAMTAPVIQTPLEKNSWHVRFVMPSNYTLETLPKPNNPNIKIYQQPASPVIVIQFNGKITDKNIDQHLTELKSYMQQHQITAQGAPIYAFYNPPWTLPFMRRNEIIFLIEDNQTEKPSTN